MKNTEIANSMIFPKLFIKHVHTISGRLCITYNWQNVTLYEKVTLTRTIVEMHGEVLNMLQRHESVFIWRELNELCRCQWHKVDSRDCRSDGRGISGFTSQWGWTPDVELTSPLLDGAAESVDRGRSSSPQIRETLAPPSRRRRSLTASTSSRTPACQRPQADDVSRRNRACCADALVSRTTPICRQRQAAGLASRSWSHRVWFAATLRRQRAV